MYTSRIILNKENYKKNLKFISKIIGTKVIISSVIKGDAYGHSIKSFVPMAEECGINHFSVFSEDEAFVVKKYSKGNPTIMIMGAISSKNINWIIENDIEFYVFNYQRLLTALKFAKRLKKKIKIHIEVETGLNRTGLSEEELPQFFDILRENKKNIELKGLCTHFAGAESIANYYRIKKQRIRFKKYIDFFEKNKINCKLIHAASSAAAITMPKTRFDMVRVGIMQYGFWPSAEVQMFYMSKRKSGIDPLAPVLLAPVLSWESKIMSIKSVNKSEYIGYSNNYLVSNKMKIGTVPVGYSDGYSRTLSDNSYVIIKNKLAKVVGIINMNLFQVDLTHIEDVKIGDKVILVGKDSDVEIKFNSFDERKNFLNYEILTKIDKKIPRKIIEN